MWATVLTFGLRVVLFQVDRGVLSSSASSFSPFSLVSPRRRAPTCRMTSLTEIGGSEDELKAQAQKFVGEFSMGPEFDLHRFPAGLARTSDGSYQGAASNAPLVNPNVFFLVSRSRARSLKPATGRRRSSTGRVKIASRPIGNKPGAATSLRSTKGALSLTRYNKTTKLLAKQPVKECVASGCSGEVCADEARVSPCIFRPEFACYKKTTCERQADGACGWTMTPTVQACLAKAANPTTAHWASSSLQLLARATRPQFLRLST